MEITVYLLVCPCCGCPRYVGQSQGLNQRLLRHRRGMRASDACHHKKRWVQQLLDQGLCFEHRVLAVLDSAGEADAAEIYWIKFFRDAGCPLTNLTDGGGGFRGRKHSAATRAKMSRPQPAAARAHMSAVMKGRKSPKKGTTLSEAHRAKLVAAWKLRRVATLASGATR